MKNRDNIQPFPNPKEPTRIRVHLVRLNDSGKAVPDGYGYLNVPMAGKLQKVKTECSNRATS